MASKAFILFVPDLRGDIAVGEGDARWQIGCVQGGITQIRDATISRTATEHETADAIYTALRQLGYQREPMLLALPSSICLCASVRIDGLSARGRQAALDYRLEEHLPVSAEDVTADFVPSNSDMALGVCVQNEGLLPLIQSLQSKGIAIDSISPAALLALQHERTAIDPPACDAFLFGHEQSLELFKLKNGELNAWFTIGQNVEEVLLHLNGATEQADGSVRVCGVSVPDHLVDSLNGTRGVKVTQSRSGSLLKSAAATAALVLAGKQTAWVELHRGGLSIGAGMHRNGKPVAMAIASIFFLMAGLCVAMFARAERYQSVTASLKREQQTLFRQALPLQQLPLDIPSRLRSEEQQLHSAGGGVGSNVAPQRILPEPLLVLLRDSLGSLTLQFPFRLSEIRLADDHFTFEGSARSLADASALADALKNQAGVVVDGPMIQQASDRGVNFTINGAAKGVSSQAGERGMP